MARKNEILLSIALEGDQEIKSKLAAVGEAGKRSLSEIEKNVGQAGSRLEKLAKPLEGVREGLAPLLEQAGLARLGTVFGGGGLLAGLSGAAGPAALVATLSALALHLAKVREESEKADSRLKSLGGGAGAIDKLAASAKNLGVSPSQLQGGLEGFLADRRAREANDRSIIRAPGFKADENQDNRPQIFAGGKLVSGPLASTDQFLAAQSTLIRGARVDAKSTEDAIKAADDFLASLRQNNGLTPEALGALGKVSPNDANVVSRAVGSGLGRGELNPDQLSALIRRQGSPIPTDQVFRALAKAEPATAAAAEESRGVTQAFDGLKASAARLDKTFGDIAGKQINKGLTEQIDQLSGGLSKATEVITRNKASIEKGSEIGRTIGDKTPIPFAGAIGATLGSITGGTIGVGGDLIKQGLGSIGVGDFLGKALTNPGSLQEKVRPTEGPNALLPERPSFLDSVSPKALLGPDPTVDFERRRQELKSFQDRGISPEREGGGFLIAPERPSPQFTPEQTQPVQPPQQFGQVDGAQQFASLSTAIQSLVDGLAARLNGLNPPETKVQGPIDGIGIRGEGDSGIKSDVAEAGGALKEFAASLYEAANSLKAAKATPQTVQAAADGGLIRHLDGGGPLAGPGTSTSDSIPAMLSDGEYVIKASSAKKLGRGALDWLNAGRFAGGGLVSRLRRFAEGGEAGTGGHDVYPNDPAGGLRGSIDVTYDPESGGAYVNGNLYQPGDPILEAPLIKAALERSKASMRDAGGKRKYKSDFVGRFGHSDDSDSYVATGGLITSAGVVRPSHFAGGGAVGNLAAFAGMTARFPHFAEGGLLDAPALSGPAPRVADLQGPGGSAGHYDVDLRTNHGDFRMMTTEDVARRMTAAARDAANSSAGSAPSWEYGR